MGTSRFHRTAAYTRCLRCAGAPRRPASGSELLLHIPSWHAALSNPGKSDIDIFQNFDANIGLRRMTTGSALQHSRNPFHAGGRFRGFTGSLPLRPARSLAPLYGSDWVLPQPPRTFTSRLSTYRSPSTLLDITTTATELLCWRDSHPLEWQLASLHGHFRPRQRTLPPGPLPLRPNKRTHALQQIREKHWRKSDLLR